MTFHLHLITLLYHSLSGFLGCKHGGSARTQYSTKFIQEIERLHDSSRIQHVSLRDKHCSLHEALGKQRHLFVPFYDSFGMWYLWYLLLLCNWCKTNQILCSDFLPARDGACARQAKSCAVISYLHEIVLSCLLVFTCCVQQENGILFATWYILYWPNWPSLFG